LFGALFVRVHHGWCTFAQPVIVFRNHFMLDTFVRIVHGTLTSLIQRILISGEVNGLHLLETFGLHITLLLVPACSSICHHKSLWLTKSTLFLLWLTKRCIWVCL
jgi:hypothetical protein